MIIRRPFVPPWLGLVLALAVVLSPRPDVLGHAQDSHAPDAPSARQKDPDRNPGSSPTSAKQKVFIDEVRERMFAGFRGDSVALDKAMSLCEEKLKADPEDADALVWHGSGLYFRAAKAFGGSDSGAGKRYWAQAMSEVDRAVALGPDRVSVRIARGAALLSLANHVPDHSESVRLLKKGVDDFEKTRELQKPYFKHLSVHARGELYGGLAAGWYGLNDLGKVRAYHELMVKELPKSEYAVRARDWLDHPTKGAYKPITCIGCHE